MKPIGIILIVIGLIGLLLTLEATKSFIPIKLPESISETTPRIISIVIAGLGLIILVKKGENHKGGKQSTEVPIYEGNKIVGYRRV